MFQAGQLQTNFPQDISLLLGIGAAVILVVILGGIAGYFIGRRIRLSRFRRLKDRKPTEVEQFERERWRKIYSLSSNLSTTLNYEKILDSALDVSTSALTEHNVSSSPLVSAAVLFDSNELVVRSARRFTSADMRAKLPGVQGLIGEAINKGQAVITRDVSQDPELSRIIAMRYCSSAYCIPLRGGLDVFGALLFAHPREDFFSPDNCEILDTITIQVMNALQNARLYQNLEQEKERLAETQEEARKKLARDLHDGPTQSIAAIAMRVNFARRLVEKDPGEAAKELFKIEDLARKTTKEIRHMLFTLRPLVLESKGLQAALEVMAGKLNETYGQKVIVSVDENALQQLDMGKQGIIFNIADEAVNNARKHAQANHIWVRLRARNDLAMLEIRDDGVGFDMANVESSYDLRGSLGMVNLRERAELINGVLQIHSKRGGGTQIQVWIPLTEEASERIWHQK